MWGKGKFLSPSAIFVSDILCQHKEASLYWIAGVYFMLYVKYKCKYILGK